MTQATICPLIPPPPPHSTHNCHSMKRELSPLDLRTSVMGSILSELGLSSLLEESFLVSAMGVFCTSHPPSGEREVSILSFAPSSRKTNLGACALVTVGFRSWLLNHLDGFKIGSPSLSPLQLHPRLQLSSVSSALSHPSITALWTCRYLPTTATSCASSQLIHRFPSLQTISLRTSSQPSSQGASSLHGARCSVCESVHPAINHSFLASGFFSFHS